MIHFYYGDGKGKTTAALGLLLRAAGCGWRCALVQFLKDWDCGELRSLERLGVEVLRGKADGAAFAKDMSEAQLLKTREIHEENLRRASMLCRDGGLLVLDEVTDALKLGLLDETPVRELLDKCRGSDDRELVVTGHAAPSWIAERADYITELVKRRHPYDGGVTARRGIEW
jgi:cob(I)alamin adenosyltransferase